MNTVSGTAMLLRNLPVWFTPIACALRGAGKPAASRPRPRVLVIDDNNAARELLSLYLGEKGIEVATVRSVAEAKTLVTRGQFDLVILEWRLEGGAGLDLLPLCKTRHPGNPVIIFSDAGPDGKRVEGDTACEPDAVVSKSGPLEALSKAITHCLSRRSAQSLNAA